MGDKCFNFKEGMNEYSKGTDDCPPCYAGCIYRHNGRCCYDVATIQQATARACHDAIIERD